VKNDGSLKGQRRFRRFRIEEKYKRLLEDMNDGYIVYQDGKIVVEGTAWVMPPLK
jgi:hypothetical protein